MHPKISWVLSLSLDSRRLSWLYLESKIRPLNIESCCDLWSCDLIIKFSSNFLVKPLPSDWKIISENVEWSLRWSRNSINFGCIAVCKLYIIIILCLSQGMALGYRSSNNQTFWPDQILIKSFVVSRTYNSAPCMDLKS